jgi:hypothetical protein
VMIHLLSPEILVRPNRKHETYRVAPLFRSPEIFPIAFSSLRIGALSGR